jgi:hypothetical protein
MTNTPQPGLLRNLMEKEIPPETPEQAYRRAYRDGWIQAIEAFAALMNDASYSRKDAYNQIWSHWEELLADWEQEARDNGAGELQLPPAIPVVRRR